MKTKLLLITFTVIVSSIYSITNSNYNELAFFDDSQTIKELKTNIDLLDKTNVNLDKEYEVLNTDYELKSFLRRDLTLIEFNKIRNLVGDYNFNKSKIELELYKKARDLLPIVSEGTLLLEEKRKLYSGLIPYINISYKSEYLDYIKADAKLFNEQREVTTNIISKQEILSNKVETIENKIKEHNNYLNESIKIIIETRLDEKITNLNENESFNLLNNLSKIKVLDKTIAKIKLKLKDLELGKYKTASGILLEDSSGITSKPNSNILDKKIQTYYIAVEKLEEFKNTIK